MHIQHQLRANISLDPAHGEWFPICVESPRGLRLSEVLPPEDHVHMSTHQVTSFEVRPGGVSFHALRIGPGAPSKLRSVELRYDFPPHATPSASPNNMQDMLRGVEVMPLEVWKLICHVHSEQKTALRMLVPPISH